MDFITWWFEGCPIASTIFTPFWVMIWAIWADDITRFLFAFVWWVICGGITVGRK